jgi:hypothetical protein
MAWSADEPTDKNGKEVPEELSEIEKFIKLLEAFIEVVTSGILDEILKNPETRTKFLDACQTLASVLGDLGAPFAGAIAEVMDLARNWENMSGWRKAGALLSIGWEVASELALGALKKVATVASLALKGGKIAAGLSKLEGTLSALGAAMTTKGINIGEKFVVHRLDTKDAIKAAKKDGIPFDPKLSQAGTPVIPGHLDPTEKGKLRGKFGVKKDATHYATFELSPEQAGKLIREPGRGGGFYYKAPFDLPPASHTGSVW